MVIDQTNVAHQVPTNRSPRCGRHGGAKEPRRLRVDADSTDHLRDLALAVRGAVLDVELGGDLRLLQPGERRKLIGLHVVLPKRWRAAGSRGHCRPAERGYCGRVRIVPGPFQLVVR